MITATAMFTDGTTPAFVLGFVRKDIDRLISGDPIVLETNAEEHGRKLHLFILFAETAEELRTKAGEIAG